jgi:hypothetical protein
MIRNLGLTLAGSAGESLAAIRGAGCWGVESFDGFLCSAFLAPSGLVTKSLLALGLPILCRTPNPGRVALPPPYACINRWMKEIMRLPLLQRR